jgi:hypothetical protein
MSGVPLPPSLGNPLRVVPRPQRTAMEGFPARVSRSTLQYSTRSGGGRLIPLQPTSVNLVIQGKLARFMNVKVPRFPLAILLAAGDNTFVG